MLKFFRVYNLHITSHEVKIDTYCCFIKYLYICILYIFIYLRVKCERDRGLNVVRVAPDIRLTGYSGSGQANFGRISSISSPAGYPVWRWFCQFRPDFLNIFTLDILLPDFLITGSSGSGRVNFEWI